MGFSFNSRPSLKWDPWALCVRLYVVILSRDGSSLIGNSVIFRLGSAEPWEFHGTLGAKSGEYKACRFPTPFLAVAFCLLMHWPAISTSLAESFYNPKKFENYY